MVTIADSLTDTSSHVSACGESGGGRARAFQNALAMKQHKLRAGLVLEALALTCGVVEHLGDRALRKADLIRYGRLRHAGLDQFSDQLFPVHGFLPQIPIILAF